MKTKTTFLFLAASFLTLTIACQVLTSNQNFTKDYEVFLKKQKSPLLKTTGEVINLDGTTWVRSFGDYEYYLVPHFKDKMELNDYNKRIRSKNNKAKGVCKSISKVVKVPLSPKSIQMLDNFNINVPAYIQDQVNVRLPQIDIDSFMDEGMVVEFIEKDINILNSFPKPGKIYDGTQEVFWSEDFEGDFPGSNYIVGDDNPLNGEDYWDDVDCWSYEGQKSIWCAGFGDESPCEYYDDRMLSYVQISTFPTIDTCETYMEFATWYDIEINYDEMVLYKHDAINGWGEVMSFDGFSDDWEVISISVQNFWNMVGWRFILFTDPSEVHEGAYIDDMIIFEPDFELISIIPENATIYDEITITFDAEYACYENGSLAGLPSIAVHSGVTINGNAWQNVVPFDGTGANGQATTLESNPDGTFSITYVPADFYGIEPGDNVTEICAVFNNGINWDEDGRDYDPEGTDCIDFFIPIITPIEVTFQVDMSEQAVSSEGVHIVGDFQDWDPGATQMILGTENLYTYTINLISGDTIQYTYINGDEWGEEEIVPPECAYGEYSNRQLIVPASPLILPLVCYSSCNPCENTVEVTFQVDMSEQNVSSDGVHIAGSFQGWDPGATPMLLETDNIYAYSATFISGDTIQFKFINGDEWGEDESVPPECAMDINRFVIVPESNIILDQVCFGDCDPCNAGSDENIDLANLAGVIHLYPNPASNTLYIGSDITFSKIEIFSLIGKCLYKSEMLTREKELDISTFYKGVYYIAVSFENGVKSINKFIKN